MMNEKDGFTQRIAWIEDESVEAIGIAAQNICDKINKGFYKRSNIKKTFKDKLSFNVKCEKVIEDICSL